MAEGIAGAALEAGAQAVVIGWPDQAKRSAGTSDRAVVDELAAVFVYLASPQPDGVSSNWPNGQPSDAPEPGAPEVETPARIGLVDEAFAAGRVRPNMSRACSSCTRMPKGSQSLA